MQKNTLDVNSSFDSLQKNIRNLKEDYVVGMLIFIMAIIIIMLIRFFYNMSVLETTTCKTFGKMYGNVNGKIQPMNDIDDFKYLLRDYYIKTAYNCCSTGDYKNGIVSTCALKDVLKQGARALDFEIYSIGNEPVVATSTDDDNYYVKETFNTVQFQEVMSILTSYAFSGGSVPNPSDPLIIHLRFKSTNIEMYKNL